MSSPRDFHICHKYSERKQLEHFEETQDYKFKPDVIQSPQDGTTINPPRLTGHMILALRHLIQSINFKSS